MQLIIIFSCFALLCDVESEAFVCVEGHLPGFFPVRPSVEYASAVWDPYTRNQINQLEQVQRRAARFVNNNFYNREPGAELTVIYIWDCTGRVTDPSSARNWSMVGTSLSS
jgi:hypothetical protein